MYNSKIIILFLHYDLFRPLFLAIIRQYLYSPSEFSVISFPLTKVYNLGKVVFLFAMQVFSYRLKQIL
jgi:hypothetical protein